jgi:hypothetical protein
MKPKKPRYKGELAKPIRVGSIPIRATNEEQSEWIEQVIEQEMIEKLPLLMEHYKIADKDDYFSLALALAMDHVKGFRVVRAALKLKHGNWGAVINVRRPTAWPRERLLRLLNAVEAAKQRYELSTDREALAVVRREREWQPPANHRGDLKQWLETLESRLQDAKRIRREEQNGGPALDPDCAAILRKIEESVSDASVYAALPLELRFTALCLPFSIEQSSEN